MDIKEVVKKTIEQSGVAVGVKAGYKSTEFGIAAPVIIYLLYQGQTTGDSIYGLAAAAVVIVYTLARALVKRRN